MNLAAVNGVEILRRWTLRKRGKALNPWLLAILSAILLELPFPIAGPMPPWRGMFAWFAVVPLLAAFLGCGRESRPVSPLQGALLGYLAGVLWNAGNCYWIYSTTRLCCGVSPASSSLILLGLSLLQGGYFALFGFLMAFLRHRFNSRAIALLAAPILWVAIDFFAYHFTSMPWGQLGYSQVNNAGLNWLAPWTGVYGITFVLILENAAISLLLLPEDRLKAKRPRRAITMALLAAVLLSGTGLVPIFRLQPASPATVTATLIQPNLEVAEIKTLDRASWQKDLQAMDALGRVTCLPFMAGIPDTGLSVEPNQSCLPGKTTLLVWPEAPSPPPDSDPRFRDAVSRLAAETHATAVIGSMGEDRVPGSGPGGNRDRFYNSATIAAPDGTIVGRYDKIHLVPFGEYTPHKGLLSFIGGPTQDLRDFSRGTMRKVFNTDGHRYGVFICYEAVFGDEVRQFAASGAEALIEISDDAWWGDTSVPWQHLNITRMRALENRRWIMFGTNDGVTAVIDSNGRVTASIARRRAGVLTAPFGYEHDMTFYTAHGDLFAGVCVLVSSLFLLRAQLFGFAARRGLTLKHRSAPASALDFGIQGAKE
ncbi:MAG: apolipoprotein N-acyltransferase [Terracidiphilus sp.]